MLELLLCSDPLRSLDHCLASIARFSAAHPERRAFLLVPETMKADAERRYLEAFDQQGLMTAEVLSFRRLAYRLFSEAGGLEQPRLSKIGKALLVAEILHQERQSFERLARAAGMIGTAQELAEVLGDFQRYAVDAKTLAAIAPQMSGSLRQAKVHDLSLLEAAYQARKEALGLVDAEDDLPRLTKKLWDLHGGRGSERLAFLRQAKIWVAGFGLTRQFTPIEDALLEALEAVLDTLTITVVLPEEKAGEAYLAGEAMEAQYRRKYPQAKRLRLPDTRGMVPEFLSLHCQDAEAEAAFVAGELLRAIKEGEFRPRDVAVALCQPEQEERLRDIFHHYGLDPVHLGPSHMDESPLLRAMEAFAKLAVQPAPFSELMALARTGLLPVDDGALDAFENHAVALGIEGVWQLEQPPRHPSKAFEALQSFFNKHLAFFAQEAKALAGCPSAQEKAAFLLDFLLDRSGFKEALEAKIASERTAQDRALLLAQSWELCVTVLEEAKRLFDRLPMDALAFARLLTSSLFGSTLGSIPMGLDRIRVGSPAALLLYPAKFLCILGATASSFPPAIPAEGFLHADEREEIEALTGLRLQNARRHVLDAGAHLVPNLLKRPSQRLLISCPRLEASERSAAQLMMEARYPKAVVEVKGDARPDQRWLEPRKARLQLALQGSAGSPALPLALPWYRPLPQSLQLWSEGLGEEPESEGHRFDDPLDQPAPELQLPAHLQPALQDRIRSLSVTRLQQFASCPYAHYASYQLGLQERRVYAPDSAVRGSLLHGMMEAALEDLLKGLEAVQGQEAAMAERLAAWKASMHPAYVAKLYARSLDDPRFLAYHAPSYRAGEGARLKAYALEALRFTAEAFDLKSFVPLAGEWTFPDPVKSPALLDLGGRPIQVQGQIDRVDQDKAGRFRICDYKSSGQNLRLEALLHGLHLQLPLYAAAWQAAHPAMEPAAMQLQFFTPLALEQTQSFLPPKRAPGLEAKTRQTGYEGSGKELGRLARFAVHRAQRLLEQMGAGEISPRPRKLGAAPLLCRFCKHQALCRYDERTEGLRQLVLAIPGQAPGERRKGALVEAACHAKMAEALGEETQDAMD